jgi:hypothetical protein
VEFFDKLFYLRDTALVNQVTVTGFAFGDVAVNGGEYDFFYFSQVVENFI